MFVIIVGHAGPVLLVLNLEYIDTDKLEEQSNTVTLRIIQICAVDIR